MPSADPIVSTGRGGAGNIGRDPTVYTDGEIVREGFQGEPDRLGAREYSTGRGGAGNIGSPRLTPQPVGDHSGTGTPTTTKTTTPAAGASPAVQPQQKGGQDIIPETALRQAGAGYENYHTGRGGEGNVHREKYGGHSGPQKPAAEPAGDKDGAHQGGGLGEKVKQLFHKGEKKE